MKNTAKKSEEMKTNKQPKKKETFYGFIKYVQDVSDEKECPDCNGKGYDPWDGGQCDRYAGTGLIPRGSNAI